MPPRPSGALNIQSWVSDSLTQHKWPWLFGSYARIAAYTAAKGGLEALTPALAAELGMFGITVRSHI